MGTPVKHKAGNLISPLLRHPRAPVAPRQGQASKRQASPTKVIKQLPLQAQLSRVKMSETPSQTSRDRNLSERSIVGPYTIEFPASVTAKDGFHQAPIPSLSRLLKNSRVIPGRPVRGGPGNHEHWPSHGFL